MKSAWFGFKQVTESEKTHLVQGVFHNVSRRYNLMNDLMSLGIHRHWKEKMVEAIVPYEKMAILDVAGGTGDIAFRLLAPFQNDPVNAPHITLCDINQSMIEVGRNNALDKGITERLTWVCGDAAALPIPSASMDVYTIAFGLRNVTHLAAALKEARRVLKPGGRFFCLEFSKVQGPLLKSLYHFYTFQWVPLLGKIMAKDRDSYQYLAESIDQFLDAHTLCEKIKEAGFERVGYQNFLEGVVALHTAS